jgi:hypothetical protein
MTFLKNAVLAAACAWMAWPFAVTAFQPIEERDAAIAALMQQWQRRILAEGLPVADPGTWSLRHMAKLSRLAGDRLRLAQSANTLEELELLLLEPPIAEGTRLGFALAANPKVTIIGGAARPKASPASAPSAYADLAFTALSPCRIYDSRPSQGGFGPWAAASTNVVSIGPNASYAFQGGSPSDCGMSALIGSGKVAAIMASVATSNQAGAGFLTFFSHGAANPFPTAISQAFQAGSVQTSFVIIPTDLVGAVSSDGYTTAQTHVIIDVLGYFAQPKAAALDCVSTTAATLLIAAGTSGQAVPAACSAGYTAVAPRCVSDSSLMTLVSTNGGCVYQNDDTAAHNGSAYSTCCRVPGR